MQPREIAVLAFNDISPFHLSVPCLVFEDRIWAGLPTYHLRICAGESARKGACARPRGLPSRPG